MDALFAQFNDTPDVLTPQETVSAATSDAMLLYFMIALHSGNDDLFASLLADLADDTDIHLKFSVFILCKLYVFAKQQAAAMGMSFPDYVDQCLTEAKDAMTDPEGFMDGAQE